MNCFTTRLENVLVIEPDVHLDNRGFFMETYTRIKYQKLGITEEFVQFNHSRSKAAGVVRGMHYQLEPKAQSKLIYVLRGEILNVVVDMRRKSPTFGHWLGVELSAENKKQLFVPKGFANGFCTLAPDTEILYQVDEYYAPEYDRCFRWNDPDIGIKWPVTEPVLSERDRHAPAFRDVENNFHYRAKS